MSNDIYLGEVDSRRFDRFEEIMRDQLEVLKEIASELTFLRSELSEPKKNEGG